MKITVTPKVNVKATAQFFGTAFGTTAFLRLEHGQMWSAERRKGYWFVTEKSPGFELRLTESAMNRLFEEVKKQ